MTWKSNNTFPVFVIVQRYQWTLYQRKRQANMNHLSHHRVQPPGPVEGWRAHCVWPREIKLKLFLFSIRCSKLTAQSAARGTSSSCAADNGVEAPAATVNNVVTSSGAAPKAAADSAIASTSTQMSIDDDDVPKLWGHSMRPSPTYLRLAAASSKPRQK